MARRTIDGVRFKYDGKREKHRRFFRRMVRTFKSDMRSDMLEVELQIRDVPKGIKYEYEDMDMEYEDEIW